MKKSVTLVIILAILLGGAYFASAQQLIQDQVTTEKAEVTQILDSKTTPIEGTNVKSTIQTIKAKILEGDDNGQSVIINNDRLNLKVGDLFYARHTVNKVEGIDTYIVADPYRLPVLYFFIGLFVLAVLVFGGKQGARGLIALVLSFAFIMYLLLPGILQGYSPVLISIGVSSLIIILGSYITHGFNKVTSSAVFGMILTIIVTGGLALLAIHWGRLTGFTTEESVYLNFSTAGTIDFSGLLLGGIMIGLLGVLYDAAIGQAVAVDELHHVGPHLPRSVIFKRALRIGREHIGALVNTLAIAYVGASLPLLLLFMNSSATLALTVNQELFATEIIRIMIGSIGLILAVPITTWIASMYIVKRPDDKTINPAVIAYELRNVEEHDKM
jgi:uncharacterized membrane protein